jgi:superfamily II DNA or RNA helicase
VITNYAVLAEGFDAPSVRAVYIARPVFAPNRYQQMVGRGLRGPLNGGKEECLIVDVEDNFINFDEQLAFREFEYLWNGDDRD